MADGASDRTGSVLVVDDDRDVLEAVVDTLREVGWTVVTAAGAAEGLAVARAQAVDVVLTDVLMPDSDGLALASALRADSATASIPIVFMTASLRHVRLLDGETVIGKPFEVAHLLSVLRSCLARRRG
jgi:CheY-like chemotaxis protein